MKKMGMTLTAVLALAACSATRSGTDAGAGSGTGSGAAGSVEVYKSRGALQCQSAGTAPEDMRRELAAAGIAVLSQACGTDGRLYPAMCGRPDGRINIFVIPAGLLGAARALGFAPLSDLPDAARAQCLTHAPDQPPSSSGRPNSVISSSLR